MNQKTLIAAGAVALLSVAASAASAATPGRSCFQMNQLQGTRADGDQRIYARVGVKEIYRIDLAHRCSSLLSQEGIVLTPTGGNNLICTPLDLDLRARDLGGFSTPCIISGITRLTAEEAAALPAKVKP